MTTLPGPGALIHTNYDPTVLRIQHVVPHAEHPGWWCFLCVREGSRHRRRSSLEWFAGQYIVKWYRLEAGRLLGRRFGKGQAMYHAIVGREANGVEYRTDGPEEVACEVFVVTPERQLALFA
jgi:hypothetical protein